MSSSSSTWSTAYASDRSDGDNLDLFRDVFLLSLCAFLGNIGVAITGFGMAIIYLFIYQILVLSGYDEFDSKFSNFKYAIFIQALALFSAQVSLTFVLCFYLMIDDGLH